MVAFQGYRFKTISGLPFSYKIKTGRNGELTKELWINRREGSKSLTRSSVLLALGNIKGEVVDGKPVDGAVASLKRGRLKITPERIAEAPDLLHFEKGIYCAFMKKGTVKGDIVLYDTNFGVTLPTCGNQRTLTSFLGFKKCSLDGLVTLVDAPYRVYDNTVQYRRYLRSKAKREQAV